MNLFSMFKNKKVDPFYVKLKKLNHRHNFVDRINSAYYLGGVVYSNENYEKILQAISQNGLNVFFEENLYNTRKDNIELFWVNDENKLSKIIIILDPVELYENEEILKIIVAPSSDLMNMLTMARQIYP